MSKTPKINDVTLKGLNPQTVSIGCHCWMGHEGTIILWYKFTKHIALCKYLAVLFFIVGFATRRSMDGTFSLMKRKVLGGTSLFFNAPVPTLEVVSDLLHWQLPTVDDFSLQHSLTSWQHFTTWQWGMIVILLKAIVNVSIQHLQCWKFPFTCLEGFKAFNFHSFLLVFQFQTLESIQCLFFGLLNYFETICEGRVDSLMPHSLILLVPLRALPVVFPISI